MHLSQFLFPALILALVLRRSLRGRRIRTGSLWLVPGGLVLVTVLTLAGEPFPTLLAIAGFLAAATVGGAVGWLRARHQQFSLDPDKGTITAKATPIGTVITAAFFALRYAIEAYSHSHSVAHSLGLTRATDAGLIFGAAMSVAGRFELWQRTRPMLTAHRAAKLAAAPELAPAAPAAIPQPEAITGLPEPEQENG